MASLFPTIPLSVAIKLGADVIETSQTDLNISEKGLRSLFNFATSETHFLFKGKFYDQIYGIAMGSPIAPVLANLFMGHYEQATQPLSHYFFYLATLPHRFYFPFLLIKYDLRLLSFFLYFMLSLSIVFKYQTQICNYVL